MNNNEKPIGFFDSGVGGISVLKEAIRLMPNENYIYFGDSKNAPYGIKSLDEVRGLTFKAADFLFEKNIKALVVACNTATSAAIEELRTKYINIPIIGIEPALKPAVEMKREGKIIIMATPMTLSETKFINLMMQYKNGRNFELLPCPGLVELIESGIVCGEKIYTYLFDKLKPYLNMNITAIVLGCTHYPFVKNEIKKITYGEVPIIDGSFGTAKQLNKQLKMFNLENNNRNIGNVNIYNSLDEDKIIKLSYKLLSR